MSAGDGAAPGGADPASRLPLVGIIVVSHSAALAQGVCELVRQIAPDVTVVAAGGSAAGGIGTDFDRISHDLSHADSGSGVALLCDMGSAVMTAESAVELADPAVRERAKVADAPVVEGAVAAAVRAQLGGSLDEVLRAAESAWTRHRSPAGAAQAPQGRYERTAVLVNPQGLHARPAAEFVKLASTFDAKITVNGRDAKSLLAILSLGLASGAALRIEADADARVAVDALARLVESGFGEPEPER